MALEPDERDNLPPPVIDDDSDSDDMPPPLPSMFGPPAGMPDLDAGPDDDDLDGLPPMMPSMMPSRSLNIVSNLKDSNPNKIPMITEVEEEIDSDTEVGYDENVIFGGWKFSKTLGSGSYATVIEAIKGDRRSACKMMNKTVIEKATRGGTRSKFVKGKEEYVRHGGKEIITNEIKVLCLCKSAYVLDLHEVIEDRRLAEICLFLEYAPLGDLMDWDVDAECFKCDAKLPEDELLPNKHFTETSARNYFICLIKGLQALHGRNIAHFDIKPQNLLLFEPGYCKLGDFGTCLIYDDEDPMVRGTSVGTTHFYSPGSCKGKKRSPYPDDIWAAGVCLYVFLTGKVPFWSESGDLELFNLIEAAEVQYRNDLAISDAVKDLLSKILTKTDKTRLSLAQILEHPWCQA